MIDRKPPIASLVRGRLLPEEIRGDGTSIDNYTSRHASLAPSLMKRGVGLPSFYQL